MSRYEETRLFVLNDAQARLCPALALEIGLNESIIFLQLEFLIAIKGTVIEERRWLRMPIRELELQFPFWSVPTINRAILSLIKSQLLLEGKFNERTYDKARWFSINLDVAAGLSSIAIKPPDSSENEPQISEPENRPPVENKGGHDTRSNQNVTRSNQFVTRSNQNDTTIDRELNKENKSLENKSTHTSIEGHDTDSPQNGVCVKPNYERHQYREYAWYSYRNNLGVKFPEAWASKAFDTRKWDYLLDEYFMRFVEGEESASAPASYDLSLDEAVEYVEMMLAIGTTREMREIIADIPTDDETRALLIEKFVTGGEAFTQ
jgi:hypothetical protein